MIMMGGRLWLDNARPIWRGDDRRHEPFDAYPSSHRPVLSQI
jgi:hypothetical protein